MVGVMMNGHDVSDRAVFDYEKTYDTHCVLPWLSQYRAVYGSI